LCRTLTRHQVAVMRPVGARHRTTMPSPGERGHIHFSGLSHSHVAAVRIEHAVKDGVGAWDSAGLLTAFPAETAPLRTVPVRVPGAGGRDLAEIANGVNG